MLAIKQKDRVVNFDVLMKKSQQVLCLLMLSGILMMPSHLMAQETALNSQQPDTSYFKAGKDDVNLLESVIYNHAENVKLLLERGANPNAASTTGNTPLMYAVEKGYLDIMTVLVSYGADVNAVGFNGETPLFLSIFHNDFQSAKFLLEQGANPNSKDSFGITPLIYAAATNQYQSADLLLFYEADEKVTDAEGNDPLIAAVTFENLETSDVLLQNGLNPDVQDNNGNTPAIIATQRGRYDLIELLLDYNADANIPNDKNYTPLTYALTYKDIKAAKMLIEKGADVNHQIDKGRNMTDLAIITGNDSLILLIRERGGSATPGLDFSEFNLTYGNSFNQKDYLIQFRGGFRDTKYGFFIETGIDYRPYLQKILTTIDDTVFQFRERRIGWSHSVGKYQEIYHNTSGFTLALYGSLNGYLSFPSYMGSGNNPAVSYKVIPSAGLSFSGNYFGVKTGADWYNFENSLDKGLKINISVYFRISYPKLNYDRKEIYWQ